MPSILCNISLSHGSVKFVRMAFRSPPAELLEDLFPQAPARMLPTGRCIWRTELSSLNMHRQNLPLLSAPNAATVHVRVHAHRIKQDNTKTDDENKTQMIQTIYGWCPT